MNSMFNTKVKFDEPVTVFTPHFLKNMSDLVIRTERRSVITAVLENAMTVACIQYLQLGQNFLQKLRKL